MKMGILSTEPIGDVTNSSPFIFISLEKELEEKISQSTR